MKKHSGLLVSIIVPLYNAEKYIEKCIKSIMEQTFENMEIILVDDGSIDKSGRICDEFSKKDKRIKVIHKENGGLVSARKAGILCATGEYVTYVDSDDWIDSDRIERMITVAVEKNSDLVYGMIKIQYPNNILRVMPIGIEEGYYEGENYIKLLENIVDVNNFYTSKLFPSLWAFLFRTEIIKKVQMTIPEKIRYNEDVACLFSVMLRSRNMEVLGEGGYYYYRKRQDSMCHTVRSNERKNLKLFYDYYKNTFNCLHLSKAIEKELLLCTYYALFCCDYDALALGEEYLFPFRQVTSDKKIAIYGAGAIGVMMVKHCMEHKFATVMKWVDQAHESYGEYKEKYGFKVESPEELIPDAFDYLVISLADYNVATIVKKNMIQKGIPEKKIVRFGETETFTEAKLKKIFDES